MTVITALKCKNIIVRKKHSQYKHFSKSRTFSKTDFCFELNNFIALTRFNDAKVEKVLFNAQNNFFSIKMKATAINKYQH